MVSHDPQVSSTLIELADTLVAGYDVHDFLDLLLERSAAVLGAGGGGVMLSDDAGQLQLLASTDQSSRKVEAFELECQEGPCIDSYAGIRQVVEEDLAATSRWPEFAAVALGQGYRSAFAFPLRLRTDVIGALNLYRCAPGPVEGPYLAAAQAFADMATIGILHERAVRDARALATQLQSALNSRIMIEQAKGVLAERAGLEMEEAFQVLRWYARSRNLMLRNVAAALVSGRLTAAEVAQAVDG